MRVLHLYANWKWTGPAEPAVGLAAGTARRGHDVVFMPGRSVEGLGNQIAEKARERGLTVLEGLTLDKHYRPLANRADRRRLASWLEELMPDVVHVHTLNDHLVGGAAARRYRRDLPVVRSLYDGEAPRGVRARAAYGGLTSFLLAASERVRRRTTDRFGIPPERSLRLEGAVDLTRFDPERDLPDLRDEYGIEEGDFVLGVVARIQPRRRFDVFFDALDRLASDVPNLRVLMVGRGTHMQRVAVDRAQKGLLGDRVVFTGYREGDEYVGTLALLSAKAFLWPGSDGSCRAVREAFAMGVPVIAANVGMLPEIVSDGEDGILVPHDPDALAFAVRRLALGLEERDEMAAAARVAARERFDLEGQIDRVEEVYRRLVG
ncbi:MAG: glycosyltransferase family 4 protein [Planctomycetota bacterium]|jgi:glycosyltransferase involved in cell wall biosynthesis